jgi:hypothetical protein
MIAIGVDNGGFVDLGYSFGVIFKKGMYVAVDKVAWFVLVYKWTKNSETPVAWVFGIVDKPGWSMAYNQINAFLAPEGEAHFFNKATHLFLRVLIYIAIIPSAAGKSCDFNGADFHYPPVDMYTTGRGGFFVANVMVAEYVIQWRVVELFE